MIGTKLIMRHDRPVNRHLDGLDLSKNPCPAIVTTGVSVLGGTYWLEESGAARLMSNKPPYRVPLMSEIEKIEWNGFNAISTFSGTGGSCLGYRMAGFRVLWASEFIPAAQRCYKLNHPNSILDTRDVRQVPPESILEAIDMQPGELDLLDGSPPCSAFSTAGKREAGWGSAKKYSDSEQRVDDLFFEYIRLVDGIQPKVFVAENVSGLVKGAAKGYFKMILAAMKKCGYQVKCAVLDAQWLGVPQMRQRTIFIGVRDDLKLQPAYPKPLPYNYTVADALPWVLKHGTAPPHSEFVANDRDVESTMVESSQHPCPTITTGENKGTGHAVIHDTGGQFAQNEPIADKPCPTISVSGAPSHFLVHGEGPPETKTTRSPDGTVRRKFTIGELKRICGFPDDFQLEGPYAKQWERLGRAVPPVMMKAIAETVRDRILIPCKKASTT